MDAREIESLSMLHRGFTELKEANPELTYNIILDLLQGINEYVNDSKLQFGSLYLMPLLAILHSGSIFKHQAAYFLTNASSGRAR
jgi:hypothetical protein